MGRNFQIGNPFDIAYDMAVELGIEEVADLDKAAELLSMESETVGNDYRVDMDRVSEILADCL